eukprot:TRINITY_DN4249_c0_g2_i2.p1 TRINITY_DN4249_c0_g2~~TRINITY_DN4249_c0_g2_i2.p1  ORF type:complete len:477 (+),score=49.31 TRINITY_DN4249_c0_g2_i2:238-1668(+)
MFSRELDRGRDIARFSMMKFNEFDTAKKLRVDQTTQSIPIEKKIAMQKAITSNYASILSQVEEIKNLLRTCKPIDPRADRNMTDEQATSAEDFLRLTGGRQDASKEAGQLRYSLKLKEEMLENATKVMSKQIESLRRTYRLEDDKLNTFFTLQQRFSIKSAKSLQLIRYPPFTFQSHEVHDDDLFVNLAEGFYTNLKLKDRFIYLPIVKTAGKAEVDLQDFIKIKNVIMDRVLSVTLFKVTKNKLSLEYSYTEDLRVDCPTFITQAKDLIPVERKVFLYLIFMRFYVAAEKMTNSKTVKVTHECIKIEIFENEFLEIKLSIPGEEERRDHQFVYDRHRPDHHTSFNVMESLMMLAKQKVREERELIEILIQSLRFNLTVTKLRKLISRFRMRYRDFRVLIQDESLNRMDHMHFLKINFVLESRGEFVVKMIVKGENINVSYFTNSSKTVIRDMDYAELKRFWVLFEKAHILYVSLR